MSTSNESRVVLVTGAAKRLGREIALACAKAGWRVAVHYRGSEENAIETVALCAVPAGDNGQNTINSKRI